MSSPLKTLRLLLLLATLGLPFARASIADNIVRDELNVKEVGFLSSAEELVTLVPKPNFRALGARFGKRTNDAAIALKVRMWPTARITRPP